jgi:hypothetical protein
MGAVWAPLNRPLVRRCFYAVDTPAWRIYHNPIDIKTQLGMRQAWRNYHNPMITIRILP